MPSFVDCLFQRFDMYLPSPAARPTRAAPSGHDPSYVLLHVTQPTRLIFHHVVAGFVSRMAPRKASWMACMLLGIRRLWMRLLWSGKRLILPRFLLCAQLPLEVPGIVDMAMGNRHAVLSIP